MYIYMIIDVTLTKSWGCHGDVLNKMCFHGILIGDEWKIQQSHGMLWGCFKQNGKCHGMRSLKKISHEKPSMNHPLKIVHLMGIFCVLQ